MQLLGKTAVISGASRGIGLGIAKALALKGANTILLGRNQDTLDAARLLLSTEVYNQWHTTFAMDVSRATEWDRLVKQCPRPHILVNSAGVTHYSLLSRTSDRVIDDIIATNLLGCIYGARSIIKPMLRVSCDDAQGGCIINISSALAHRGGAGSSVYAASKAGVIGFTKALAEEMGSRHIRSNAIAPGYIDTDMVAGMNDQLKTSILNRTGIGRIGTIEEVAHAAVFLAESEFANGSILTLDGGLSYQ